MKTLARCKGKKIYGMLPALYDDVIGHSGLGAVEAVLSYSAAPCPPTAGGGGSAHDSAGSTMNIIAKGIVMGTQNAAGGGSQSVGSGRDNDSGEQSQRGSGGSGGAQPTRNLEDVDGEALSTPAELIDEAAPEGAGTAATASTRGAQDTHASQAGSTSTGLGAPETGANQQMSDLAPPRK